jgi:protein-tyrosine phosphatase
MIDIHSHILPNVDDGASSNEEALDMLRLSVDGGVTKQVLTPHIHFGKFNNTKADLQQKFEQFRELVEQANIDVELQLAAEVRIGPDVMALVNNNAIPWLGEYQGKKTFLLEFPRQDIPFGSDNLVKWLLAKNCLPVIVHPERNRTFGKDVQIMAEELLAENSVSAIASDSHNLKGRPPDLGPVWHNCTLFDKDTMLAKTNNLSTLEH